MDDKALMVEAMITIENLEIGRIFTVKSLFPGHRWEELTAGECRAFGGIFKRAYQNGDIPSITYIGKAQNNSAQYKKEG